MLMVKAGERRGRVHRAAPAACWSRATSSSTAATRSSRTPSAAPSTSRAKGLLYIGTGVSGGEEGARRGPSHHARRQPGRLGARQAHLPGHRRQGGRRHALLRLGGRRRRRPLREDDPQRHRVRRHAAHLRGLPHHEGRPGHDRRRDARGLQGVEQRRTGVLPGRDHPRHPRPRKTTTARRWWTRSSTPPARKAPASGRSSPRRRWASPSR